MGLMTEKDVLVQLVVIDADTYALDPQILQVDEGAMSSRQIQHCLLELFRFGGVLICPRLDQK